MDLLIASWRANNPATNAVKEQMSSGLDRDRTHHPPRFLSAIIAYHAAGERPPGQLLILPGGRPPPSALLDGSLPFSIGQYETN